MITGSVGTRGSKGSQRLVGLGPERDVAGKGKGVGPRLNLACNVTPGREPVKDAKSI